jgi:acetate kinase
LIERVEQLVSLNDIAIIGHRVVHGGTSSTRLTAVFEATDEQWIADLQWQGTTGS